MLKSRKTLSIFILTALSLLAVLLFYSRKKIAPSFFKGSDSRIAFGIISDIHADRYKKWDRGESFIYPARYKDCLRSELDKFKNAGTDFAIMAGDATNGDKETYFKKVGEIAAASGVEVFWTKGNHDRKNFHILSGNNFYSVDRGKWRIIILDSAGESYGGDGQITQEQLSFLREKMNTSQKIIISMHHPIFADKSLSVIAPQYQDFYDLVVGKARYVISGHWHQKNFEREIDGTRFIIQKALSDKNGCYSTIIEE